MRAASLASVLAASASAQVSDIYPVPAFPALDTSEFVGADLDLDGRLDALLGDVTSAISFALPEGGFAAAVTLDIGLDPRELNVADMDGNGWLDVVGCSFLGAFSITSGTGAGRFGPPQSWSVADELVGVGVGDVNGDGHVDVATLGSQFPYRLHASLADGAGGFDAPVSSLLANFKPSSGLELADFNGDGKLDAVWLANGTVSVPSRLLLSLGNGTGAFGPGTPRALPGSPGDLVVLDLELDGDLDVAVPCNATSAPDMVAILRGNGTGLTAPESWPVGSTPSDIDAGDLDGSGVPDLVTVHGNSNLVSVLLADGAGGYLPAEVLAGQVQTSGLFVSDATADGELDVVTLNWFPGAMGILAGDGAGQLTACERYAVDIPLAVTVADLDDDGHLDLIAASESRTVGTLLADGAGGFHPVEVSTLPPFPVSTGEARDVAAGDVTGDGLPDVLVPVHNMLVLFANDGSGLAPAGSAVPGSSGGTALELADLDEDGHLDALETHFDDDGSPPYPGSLLRYFGTPAGLQAPLASPAGTEPLGLAVGDVDGDGHGDAVVVGGFPGLWVLLGDGTGGLATPAATNLGSQQIEVALGDLDLDGHLDAVALKEQQGLLPRLTTLHGDGSGGFAISGTLDDVTDDGSSQIATADVDGDGWLDLVQTGTHTQAVRVRRNDTAGGWQPELWFAGSLSSYALALADLDGDHRPDVVSGGDSTVSSTDLGSFTILRNGAAFTWTDLGSALPGTLGAPSLSGTGALTPGSPGDLRLFHARPLAPALLFVSWTSSPASFKGGTLVPLPALAQLAVVTDGAGSLVAGWPAWPFASPGQAWHFQYAIADAEAVHGVALSNALRAAEP